MIPSQLVVALLFSLFVTPSVACTMTGLSRENSTHLLPRLVAESDVIIHGRVVEATPCCNISYASIVTIHSFKGGSKRIDVTGGASVFCGYHFTVGEENIYFIKDGRVWDGSVYPASEWLVRDLERALGGEK